MRQPRSGLWQKLVGRRTIVTRLVLAVAVAMAAILLVASGFVFWRVEYALNRQLDQDLSAWRGVVATAVSEGRTPPLDTPGQTYQLYGTDGALDGGNSGIPHLLDRSQVAEVAAGRSIGFDIGRVFPPPPRRGFRVRADLVRTPQGERVVVAAISRSKHDEALRELLLQLFIADLVTLIGASVVGHRAARAALDPVEAYRRAAARVGDEEVGRLPVAEDRDDELTRLGHTLNDLLARIESGAERERQYLADASHELRTPLALMSTELEWVRHRPRSAQEVDEVLTSLRGQVDRLIGLSNALLELEELRAVGPVTREEVRLPDLVADAVRDGVPRDVEVHVEVPDVTVLLDRRWLTIALTNLLANAVRHGGEEIALTAAYDDGRLRLVVHDSGEGFPEEFRGVAFDRFSRAEQSRTTPGSGLGLYLVRSVAVAHGGTAEILGGPGAAIALTVDAPQARPRRAEAQPPKS